ncbi:MAG: NYN domain-containing protein [Actinomycetota bacterium]|nr:NYN domain-containing protein [Actinomycetota bacterium]
MIRWLVDGSNVVGARPDGWWRDRPRAFARLTEELAGFARITGDEITVVYDGTEPEAAAQCPGVEVVAAPSADDRLVELASADAEPASLTAVTSDRELADRLRRTGAVVVGAGSFRRLLDESGR